MKKVTDLELLKETELSCQAPTPAALSSAPSGLHTHLKSRGSSLVPFIMCMNNMHEQCAHLYLVTQSWCPTPRQVMHDKHVAHHNPFA